MMNKKLHNRFFNFRNCNFYILFLFLGLFNLVEAQVIIVSNLDGESSDMCLGNSKKITTSVKNGSCSAFLGDVNSVNFTWQIETSPGVWVDVNSYFIQGITYGIEKKINAAGTQINGSLIINVGFDAPEGDLSYRALIQGSGGCPVATTTTANMNIVSKYWIGGVSTSWLDSSNWSCNVLPSSTDNVTIKVGAFQPVINSNITVAKLTIENGSTLTVTSGYNLTVKGAVDVQGTGSFTLQNNANLLQGSYTGANSGNVKVGRNSSALMRQDYTLWSSPVASQNLLAFSPQTLTTRFYTYNSSTNVYSAITPSTNTFETGKGYLIRMPNNHPTTSTIWAGQFTGVPNNGNISVPLYNGGAGFRFNGVGNPYPSPIKMNSFVATNSTNITGALYFWRKSNSTVTEPGYCTWTTAGFVSNGEAQVFNPNGIIRTGQGFLVEAKGTQTSLVFNNAMRIADNADQFFKNSNGDDSELIGDKIKLNVSNNNGLKNQMLIGYFENATLDVDYGIDGKMIDNYPLTMTMELNSEEYSIQGKPAFVDTDIVPFKFKTETAGEFTISIEESKGLFLEKQDVYLKDNFTNSIHNLKSSEYRFVSEPGVFANRFEVVYQNKKQIENSTLTPSNILVYKDNNTIKVISAGIILENVKVFDVSGRLLTEKKNISSNETNVPMGDNNKLLLIQITTEKAEVITKKIAY